MPAGQPFSTKKRFPDLSKKLFDMLSRWPTLPPEAALNGWELKFFLFGNLLPLNAFLYASNGTLAAGGLIFFL